MPLLLRPETEADAGAIRRVNALAFGSEAEAQLVEELRCREVVALSLVAEEDGQVLGHILFSYVEVGGRLDRSAVGLAPMAVLPGRQREGIGSALVLEGLQRCRAMGCELVVLVGHPDYYPRFGFRPAHLLGLSCEFEVPPEVFQALALDEGAATGGRQGLVRYHEAFHAV